MQFIYTAHSRYRLYLKFLLFVLSLGYLVSVSIMKVFYPEVYQDAIQEDAFFEMLQPLFYCTAAFLAGINSYLFFRNEENFYSICSCCLSIFLVFVCLEEISWGQRIFNLDVPTFFATNNFQKEISIHNLHQVQHILHYVYIAVGLFFSLACMLVSLPIPSKRLQYLLSPLYRWSPGIYTIFYFLPLALIYLALELFRSEVGKSIQWRDQEPAELLFSLGVLLLTSIVFTRFSKSSS